MTAALADAFDEFPDSMTLGEARAWLRERVDEGARCPLCRQWSQRYKRTIGADMVRALIKLWIAGGRDARNEAHLPAIYARGGDTAKLRYWGLIEELPEVREDGGHAGWWRVTEKGQAFLLGQITVPKYAKVYDGHCQRLDGKQVSVDQCIRKRFDLRELLGR